MSTKSPDTRTLKKPRRPSRRPLLHSLDRKRITKRYEKKDKNRIWRKNRDIFDSTINDKRDKACDKLRHPVPFPKVKCFVEGMSCAYYEMPLVVNSLITKRILMLGESHDIPSGEDVGLTKASDTNAERSFTRRQGCTSQLNDYLDKLNCALTNDNRCLDVYYERPFSDPTRQIASDRSLGSLDRIRWSGPWSGPASAFTPRWSGPVVTTVPGFRPDKPPVLDSAQKKARTVIGRPAYGKHARSMLYSYFPRGQTRLVGRRSHAYDMRRLRNSPREWLPGYDGKPGADGKVDIGTTEFTVDEYIAMYYGIGPRAQHVTSIGGPDLALITKWLSVQLADTSTTVSSMPYMRNLRSRHRKNLNEFMKNYKIQTNNTKFILDVIRVSVFQATRFIDLRCKMEKMRIETNMDRIGMTRVNGYALEAFADLYGFFRMFRLFDKSKNSNNNHNQGICKDIGYQLNNVTVSHYSHQVRLMILIAMVFDVAPIYMAGMYKNPIMKIVDHMRLQGKIMRNRSYNLQIPNGQLYLSTSGTNLYYLLDNSLVVHVDVNGHYTPGLVLHLANDVPFFDTVVLSTEDLTLLNDARLEVIILEEERIKRVLQGESGLTPIDRAKLVVAEQEVVRLEEKAATASNQKNIYMDAAYDAAAATARNQTIRCMDAAAATASNQTICCMDAAAAIASNQTICCMDASC